MVGIQISTVFMNFPTNNYWNSLVFLPALQASAPQLVRNVGRQNYEEFLSNFKFVGVNEVSYLGPNRLGDYLGLYSAAIRWFIQSQTAGLQPDDVTRG